MSENPSSTPSGSTCCDAPSRAASVQKQRARERFIRPRYGLTRHEDSADLRILVPGATKDSVNIAVEEGILTVKADRVDAVGKDWRPMLSELDRAAYLLKLELNADFDPEAIRAKVEHGVLHLTLPFAETAKPRAIAVQ